MSNLKAMEELVTLGKTKSIGVSNFNCEQIKEILKVCKIRPVCNQFEVNLLWQNEELILIWFNYILKYVIG